MFKWPDIKKYHLTGVSRPYLAPLINHCLVWQCRLTGTNVSGLITQLMC